MVAGKSVLGKSLGGLLSESIDLSIDDTGETLRNLPLTQIQRGKYQPRLQIEPQGLSELADSIRSQGVVQPIIVRLLHNDQYEIIAGERRFRAAKLAGLSEIPAIVREMNDETALVCALVENVQRQDLNAIDEAKALSRLVDEFALTHQEVSTLVGKSRTAVTNGLRLLVLTPAVQEMVVVGQLEAGHAKILVTLTPVQQRQLADEVIAKQLSVRQTEQRVREIQHEEKQKHQEKTTHPRIAELEQAFASQFGQKVNIQHRASGKGRLVVHYSSLAELKQMLAEDITESF